MSLGLRCQLWFGGVWFGAKAFDALLPPSNPTFNAALALSAMIACIAYHIEATAPKQPGAT